MIFQYFIHTVKDNVSERLGADYSVSLQRVLKNNGVYYESLLIVHPGATVSPLIYLNPYYHRYLNGMQIQDICEEICEIYRKKVPPSDMDMAYFFDYESVRRRLVPKLINYDKNEEMLKETPHVRYLDLAMIFLYLLPQEGIPDYSDDTATGDEPDGNPSRAPRCSYASITIRSQYLALWGISLEVLYRDALCNSPRLLAAEIKSMPQLLSEFNITPAIVDERNCPMYVVTNSQRINGAAAVLYEGLLADMAKRLESNLIVLPSSIHEVILVPAGDTPREELDDFSRMVQEVNAAQVADDEVLSNHAYYYDAGANQLSSL